MYAKNVKGIDGNGNQRDIPQELAALRKAVVSPPSSLTLDAMSWEWIDVISRTGKAPQFFRVGDKKTYTTQTGEPVTVVILGFNHDNLVSGGKAGITFGMDNLLKTLYPMNTAATTVGGWRDSEMRTITMPLLFSQLPPSLQAVIKPVFKVATAGNGVWDYVTVEDTLFLFGGGSEIEHITSTGYFAEGEQYEYWRTIKDGNANGGGANPDRVKYLSNGTGTARAWYHRSAHVTSASVFRAFGADGAYAYSANNPVGVCYGFCI